MLDFNHDIHKYCEKLSTIHDPSLPDVDRKTHLSTLSPRMLSGHLQGSLLSIISKIKQPKYILEIGTFTGYSAICLAVGLVPNGRLITIEYDPEHAHIAESCIAMSTFKSQIELVIGDAQKIIPTLPDEIDLVFIDANKEAYAAYFDLVIDKCNPGAIILADNVLWSGKVLDEKKDKKTTIIDDFNHKIYLDDRVENVIMPIRDGINVIIKK